MINRWIRLPHGRPMRFAGSLVVSVGLVSFGFAMSRPRSDSVPAVHSANRVESEPPTHLVYDRKEPVGWVFGRVVGFEGADKPLLPRQAFPAPNLPASSPAFSSRPMSR